MLAFGLESSGIPRSWAATAARAGVNLLLDTSAKNIARIQHAIALLAIDPNKQTLTVGNPLYGEQIKTFADMKDYWLKEAVFATKSKLED